MPNAQIYCSVNELICDLKIQGDESRLLQRIREASQFMSRYLGRFVPFFETRKLKGVCARTLDLGAGLLSVKEVRVDGVPVIDYIPEPSDRCWENGPYTWLTRTSGWGDQVEIDGTWGLYDLHEDLGIAVTQAIDAVDIVETDGSRLSPGMILLIGEEQELVTAGNGGERSPAATLLTAKVSGAITNGVEEIDVDDGAAFQSGEVLQIGTEDLFIRKIAGNRLVCARGWNGTTKAAHVDMSPISVYRTYSVIRGINGTAAAVHTAASVERYLPPEDVHWLALQISALMRQKALTAFGGRAGSSDLGETFYVNEFPRQIENIKANYSIPYL